MKRAQYFVIWAKRPHLPADSNSAADGQALFSLALTALPWIFQWSLFVAYTVYIVAVLLNFQFV